MAGVPLLKFMAYPNELKDAVWQKNKGKLGKIKKTGVGAELKKAEALFKKINHQRLDPKADSPKTREVLDKAIRESKAEYSSNVVPYQKQLRVVKTTAEKAAVTLKKVPGKASKAATDVAKVADTNAITCKSLDIQSRIDEAVEHIKRLDGLAAQMLGGAIKKFAVGSKKFLELPTEKKWNEHMKQQGRSVSNSVRQLKPYHDKFWKDFEKFKGFDVNALGIQGEDSLQVRKRVMLCKAAQKQVAAIAKFKP